MGQIRYSDPHCTNFSGIIITEENIFMFIKQPSFFRTWCEDITFAEEIFFATLIRVSGDIFKKTGKVVQDKTPDLDTTNGICVRRSLWEESGMTCIIASLTCTNNYHVLCILTTKWVRTCFHWLTLIKIAKRCAASICRWKYTTTINFRTFGIILYKSVLF